MNEHDAIDAAAVEAMITGKVFAVFRRQIARSPDCFWSYREYHTGDLRRGTHYANVWPDGQVSYSRGAER